MPSLKQVSQLTEYGLLIGLTVLLVVLTYRGLVSGKLRQLVVSSEGDGAVSPARLQALGVSLGFAGWYLTRGLEALSSGTPHLPDIKPEILSIVAASLGVHMGGKLYERRPRPAASSPGDVGDGDGGGPAPSPEPPSPKPRPRRRKSDGKTKP